jgi:hypothetical protein
VKNEKLLLACVLLHSIGLHFAEGPFHPPAHRFFFATGVGLADLVAELARFSLAHRAP